MAAHERAVTAAEAGDFQAAVPAFRKAIDAQPVNAALHEQLAQCLAELGEYEAAIEAASACVGLDPKVPARNDRALAWKHTCGASQA